MKRIELALRMVALLILLFGALELQARGQSPTDAIQARIAQRIRYMESTEVTGSLPIYQAMGFRSAEAACLARDSEYGVLVALLQPPIPLAPSKQVVVPVLPTSQASAPAVLVDGRPGRRGSRKVLFGKSRCR